MFRKRGIRHSKSRIHKYKIAVIGSGSREHAIAEKFAKDNKVTNVYVLPGNDGMIGNKIEIVKRVKTNREILLFCLKHKIDLVFVGPETPLVDGLVDILEDNEIKVFGPNEENAKLEGSKIYSKEIMNKYKIPTADYMIYDDYNEVYSDIKIGDMDMVIKYDGLAGGKGVFIPETQDDAINIVHNIFLNKIFGNKPKVIIEDKLEGIECSLMGFCNGKEITFMPQAQDYKKRDDNDEGPNTGGMGSIAPVNILTEVEITYMKSLLDKLVKDLNYKGILYAGLMKTKDGIFLLEFNCRFGDPEAQVLLNLLDSELYNICMDCINGNTLNINWSKKSCMNIVLSHDSYPYDKSSLLFEIKNVDKIPYDIKLYFGNITKISEVLCSNGGRVLSMVYMDEDLSKCFTKLYSNIKIDYKNIYYRRDIGYKYIQNTTKNNIINKKEHERMDYKSAGVDIDKGNDFVNVIKAICKDDDDKIGGFSGIVEYKGIKLAATTDGVGTKLEIAKKLNKYDTIGIDLVAMCVNDLIVQGAKPLLFLDYFATGKLDLEMGRNIIYGINEGCKQSGCKLVGGETAEMPITYTEDNFDLAGFSLGVIEGTTYPKTINSGDLILGLPSTGVHSNGFTLINKLLETYNYDLEELLTPTKIYVNDIEKIKAIFKDYIKGFSHITGGGLIDNINRLLDKEHNIKLNYDWDIPDVFKWIYKNSNMSVKDMLRTYNCGIGMAVIVDKNMFNDIDNIKLVNILNEHNLIPIGMIIKNDNPIIDYDLIKNKLK